MYGALKSDAENNETFISMLILVTPINKYVRGKTPAMTSLNEVWPEVQLQLLSSINNYFSSKK